MEGAPHNGNYEITRWRRAKNVVLIGPGGARAPEGRSRHPYVHSRPGGRLAKSTFIHSKRGEILRICGGPSAAKRGKSCPRMATSPPGRFFFTLRDMGLSRANNCLSLWRHFFRATFSAKKVGTLWEGVKA